MFQYSWPSAITTSPTTTKATRLATRRAPTSRCSYSRDSAHCHNQASTREQLWDLVARSTKWRVTERSHETGRPRCISVTLKPNHSSGSRTSWYTPVERSDALPRLESYSNLMCKPRSSTMNGRRRCRRPPRPMGRSAPRACKRGAEPAGTVNRRHEFDVAVEIRRGHHGLAFDCVRLREVQPEEVIELPDRFLDLLFVDDELDTIEPEDLHEHTPCRKST